MKIQVTKQKNNSQLVLIPVEGAQTVSVIYFVKAGSRMENLKNNGIAHFTEHMMFKGTKKRPDAFNISCEADGLGAYVNAATDRENTYYYIKSAGEHLSKSIDLLSDLVLNSKFDETEIEKEKGVIVEEIKMYKDNPSWHIGDLYDGLVYANATLGLPIAGEEKTVRAFNRGTFTNYFDDYYSAPNTYLIIAGNLKNENGLGEEYLSGFKEGRQINKPEILPLQDQPRLIFEERDIQQAHLQIGVPGIPFTDKRRLAAKILSIILGGNMSSRLFMELREKRGLAYAVSTRSENLSDAGQMTTMAGVRKEKAEEALQLILKEYDNVYKNVTQAELTRAKEYYKGILSISMEDISNLAINAAIQLYYTGDTLDINQIKKEIDKVSLDEVRQVAKDLFLREKLNLAIIGPYNSSKMFDKILEI
ncbi:MAG: Peptidase M16 domain protein [candidate division CPR2 bacterium GW2011_GWC1_39_9]|uniref:Peptidase M16 domain protein n=1 Tax=candidate division CPR2 bacterium GW2011_GWC2_39_10 TaxID=1618345 RepID=A0A0G0LZU1_UNCC2|nr:MAG: Peptidase M16 domain protein [candidate division CPR2 bacterium GW2011_GWC2_39_10]KKR35554.1 MAG: Peptidase M16 domain protein [candidate division CPR2 bacterium GW2011_GWC1_39_9]